MWIKCGFHWDKKLTSSITRNPAIRKRSQNGLDTLETMEETVYKTSEIERIATFSQLFGAL